MQATSSRQMPTEASIRRHTSTLGGGLAVAGDLFGGAEHPDGEAWPGRAGRTRRCRRPAARAGRSRCRPRRASPAACQAPKSPRTAPVAGSTTDTDAVRLPADVVAGQQVRPDLVGDSSTGRWTSAARRSPGRAPACRHASSASRSPPRSRAAPSARSAPIVLCQRSARSGSPYAVVPPAPPTRTRSSAGQTGTSVPACRTGIGTRAGRVTAPVTGVAHLEVTGVGGGDQVAREAADRTGLGGETPDRLLQRPAHVAGGAGRRRTS